MWCKLKQIIESQLTQGANPHGLALSCAVATACAIFPLLGFTTLLCLLFGFVVKINQPVVQILNYLLYPIQILMIPVFLRIGEWILNAPVVPINPLELAAKFTHDWRAFLSEYGVAGLHAVLAWLIIAPFLAAAIFYVSRIIFTRIARRIVA